MLRGLFMSIVTIGNRPWESWEGPKESFGSVPKESLASAHQAVGRAWRVGRSQVYSVVCVTLPRKDWEVPRPLISCRGC